MVYQVSAGNFVGYIKRNIEFSFINRKYGVSIVNLAATDRKPLIGSAKARSFKNVMFNRGQRRQTGNFFCKIFH